MIQTYRGVVAAVALFAAPIAMAEDVTIDSEQDKLSYAFGYSVGQLTLRQFGGEMTDMDNAIVARAISDVLTEKQPAISMEDIQRVIEEWQRKAQEDAAAEREAITKQAEDAKQRGLAFLKENGARSGVSTTDSGLQYEVVRAGDGDMPGANDTVVVHYAGTLIDGTEFDSSYKRDNPISFPVSGVIPGWTEALQMMKTGAKWKLYIPSELAYGERGGGPIGPNEVLIFEVELLEIK